MLSKLDKGQKAHLKRLDDGAESHAGTAFGLTPLTLKHLKARTKIKVVGTKIE
jgi:hypothetical protein